MSLGDSAMAAAGSVVTKSIPAGEIHAGNPAVFARSRSIGKTGALMNASTPSELAEVAP